MELAGARTLVTGGAGLVGSHIADLLVDAGVDEIVVIDNFTRGSRQNLEDASRSGKVTLIDGDIRDVATVNRAMDGIDLVFHQAAIRITQCAEQPREAVSVLVDGTFNVLEAAVNAKVRKVVAASSASVYGEPSYVPIDEGHPFNNRTLYGAAKVANEQILRSFNDMYELPYVALRYFNIYGPRMDVYGVYTEVLIRWLDRIEAGEAPLIFGDGKQSMDFVYITDVARANLAAMRSSVSDDVFNVASGTETTLNELAAILLELMGRPDLQPEHREERKVNPVRRRLAAIEKAREMLGFETIVDVREGLQRLVDWRKTIKVLA
ncbi:MAG: NAD-dependent epimerase/dehydratase [Chloroflexi bacterium]|nr:NAD-dependent epimerase/dehydratase [Chloroflexota bacterium]